MKKIEERLPDAKVCRECSKCVLDVKLENNVTVVRCKNRKCWRNQKDGKLS